MEENQHQEKWVFCYFEQTNEHAHCSMRRDHFAWICRTLIKLDPCDEEFMRSISS
jgi:hypothetical protein